MALLIEPKAGPLDAAWPLRATVEKVAEWLFKLDATSVPHKVGAEYVDQSDKPPRYVWVPTDDDFAPSTDKVAFNPKPLRTAWEGVRVHVWGSSYAHAWALRHALVRAVYRAAVGAFRVGGGSWVPAPPGGNRSAGARLEPTREYVLQLAFLVPVIDVTVSVLDGSETEFVHDGQLVVEGGAADNDC